MNSDLRSPLEKAALEFVKASLAGAFSDKPVVSDADNVDGLATRYWSEFWEAVGAPHPGALRVTMPNEENGFFVEGVTLGIER